MTALTIALAAPALIAAPLVYSWPTALLVAAATTALVAYILHGEDE